MTQVHIEHPLAKFGFRQHPPKFWHWGWRFILWTRTQDIWLIARGKLSLHKAWQQGYDDHIRDESARRARGGQ